MPGRSLPSEVPVEAVARAVAGVLERAAAYLAADAALGVGAAVANLVRTIRTIQISEFGQNSWNDP